MRDRFRVNEVAQMTGISVRALHHYDAIGLLVPSGRTESGYRLYDDEDLLRLQQILIGRELGLSLEDIKRSLDDPSFDRRSALTAQRKQLAERAEQTSRMIRAIDRALDALNGDSAAMNKEAMFDGFDPAKYEDEARERWGDTDAYKESSKRAKSYTKADWARHNEEAGAIYRAAFELLSKGTRPDEEAAMNVAEQHRLLIDRWFYPCSYAMHRGLGDMWEADERFAQNIDAHKDGGAGLTRFLSAAVRANAARHGG